MRCPDCARRIRSGGRGHRLECDWYGLTPPQPMAEPRAPRPEHALPAPIRAYLTAFDALLADRTPANVAECEVAFGAIAPAGTVHSGANIDDTLLSIGRGLLRTIPY